MSNAVDSANLILKLYELRREETMRKARDFMVSFDPKTFEEMQAGYAGPNSAYVRMVTGYWEMAASFVTSGAIDLKTFDAATGEHILVFSKVQPFLPQLREMFGSPAMLENLEKVCLSLPGGLERVNATRERIRAMLAMRAAASAK
ncbi:MAG TPA: hypothetical protein VG273_24705 [Bryobacteraceae bacterium]|jgi:hypothetical protein|nr:hypothetical protein [Bryobacteraceae bacterium]